MSEKLNTRKILDQLVISGSHADAIALAKHFFDNDPTPAMLDELCRTYAQTREFDALGKLLDQYRHNAQTAHIVASRTSQHLQFLKADDQELTRLAKILQSRSVAGIIQSCRIWFSIGQADHAAKLLAKLLPSRPLNKWPFHLMAGFYKTDLGKRFLNQAALSITADKANEHNIFAILFLLQLTGHKLVADHNSITAYRTHDKRLLSFTNHDAIAKPHALMVRVAKIENQAISSHIQDKSGDASAQLVLNEIMTAVEQKKPLSLIRLGDGDGNFLEDPATSPMAYQDKFNMARDFWGLSLAHDKLDALTQKMRNAVNAVDILGIPDFDRIFRQKANFFPAFGPEREMRGLESILEFVESRDAKWLASKRLVSCHIHQAMQKNGFFPALAKRVKRLHLVSCHKALKDQIESNLPVEVIFYETPIQYVEEHKLTRTVSANNLTEFERLTNNLPGNLAGEVFLVAAGFYGRLMTLDIKKRGGIAIDIGSIANEWMGVSTRMEGLELKAMQKTAL